MLRDTIRERIVPLLENEGMVLVDLHTYRGNRKIDIRLLVDRREGGITVGECAALNAKIGQVIEQENLINEHYVLELSSPGLDRPLVTREDFRRVIDKELRFFLRSPIDEKLELQGKLVAVNDASISVISGEKEIQIPIETVAKAKQVI
ncbi:ribosome maturation factor RimP [Candidatus Omnitrophota bacterium]